LKRIIFNDESDYRLSLAEEWLTKEALNQKNNDTSQERHKDDFPLKHIPDPSGQQPENYEDLFTPEGDQDPVFDMLDIDMFVPEGYQDQDASSVPEGDQQKSPVTNLESEGNRENEVTTVRHSCRGQVINLNQ